MSGDRVSPAAPWHALLAPLPAEATVRRQPVATPEVVATPHGSSIAGWEQLTVELSAGAAGLRHVMVVLDGGGRPIAANDTVLYRRELDGGERQCVHHTLGGRLEDDGSFRGTRWTAVGREQAGDEEPDIRSTPAPPTDDEIAGIRVLVDEVMRRARLDPQAG